MQNTDCGLRKRSEMAESFGEASTHTNLPGSTPQFIRAWSVTATTAWASEIYRNKQTHIKTIRKTNYLKKKFPFKS